MALLNTNVNENELKKLSSGKVRDLFEFNNDLLFVATDRISAFDVILSTVRTYINIRIHIYSNSTL